MSTPYRRLIRGMTNPVQPSSSKMPTIRPAATGQQQGRLVVRHEYGGEELRGEQRERKGYRHHQERGGQERRRVMSTHKGPNVSFLVTSALSNSAQGASRRFNNDMRWMLGLRSKTNTPLVDGAIHRDQAGDWTRLRAISNPASEGSTFVNSPRPRVRFLPSDGLRTIRYSCQAEPRTRFLFCRNRRQMRW